MTVKEIITEYLKNNGYDGLCNDDGDCGCGLDDLIPCGECFYDCMPAFKRQVTPEEKAAGAFNGADEVFTPVSPKEAESTR